MIMSDNPDQAISLLKETNLLKYIIPELENKLTKFKQDNKENKTIEALLPTDIGELINENKLLRFIKEGTEIFSPQEVIHTKNELIEIFSYANDLLRQEGMREGVERFTEFSNLLFLKLIDEIETDREKERRKKGD